MLWPLAACSIFALGIALERWLAVRRKRVMPAEFVDRFLERLSTGRALLRGNTSARRVYYQTLRRHGRDVG